MTIRRILAVLWSLLVLGLGTWGFIWLSQTVRIPSIEAGLGYASLILLLAFIGGIVIVLILGLEDE